MDTPVADTAADIRTHDVYLTTSAGRFYISNPNRGVTLYPDQIVWTFDGKIDGAPFKNIVEVHLQSGGNWQAPLNLCQIAFADRYKLIVTNGNELGIPNDEQRARYRDFVRDLHTRLAAHAAARSGPPIAFSAGYPSGRYLFLLVLTVIMALMFIGLPLVLLLLTGEIRPLMLLIVGAGFIWPLKQMMRENIPRSYDPARLPDDLMD